MADRTLVYFVSDVHLGLDVNDPADREARFVSFLKSIPKDRAKSLYLLGDIWDFWYEYMMLSRRVCQGVRRLDGSDGRRGGGLLFPRQP